MAFLVVKNGLELPIRQFSENSTGLSPTFTCGWDIHDPVKRDSPLHSSFIWKSSKPVLI